MMDDLAREILKDMALEEIAPKSQKRSPRGPLDARGAAGACRLFEENGEVRRRLGQ